MSTVTTTATTSLLRVKGDPRVVYKTPTSAQTFIVAAHAPTPRDKK